MGVWGPGISSNDMYADVYGYFFELYDEGVDVSLISKKLIDRYKDEIQDPYEKNNFWFALAKAQWECKSLDKEVFNLVKHIIESNEDLAIWEELDCEANDLKKRKLVLDQFLEELQTEKSNPRLRKKIIVIEPAFKKGDCYAFKLKNGNYGGFITLDSYKGNKHSVSLIAVTRLNTERRPDVNDFINAEVLLCNYGNWNNAPLIFAYSACKRKEPDEPCIEYIGHAEVTQKFKFNDFAFIESLQLSVIDVANKQFEYETVHDRSAKVYAVKKLIKKRWWHFLFF